MTKEIIIDGVDVSECKYFCKFTTICRNENIGRVVHPRCKNVVDCYFRQLKRVEQKLEKIKANCNETLSECSCKNPIIDIDCRECTSGGRVEKAKEILQIIEGEENE